MANRQAPGDPRYQKESARRIKSNLPITVSRVHSVIETLIITCEGQLEQLDTIGGTALTSIIRILALILLVILECIHKQRTADQTSAACSHVQAHQQHWDIRCPHVELTSKKSSSHPRTRLLGWCLLDHLGLRVIRPKPS